MDKRPEDWDNFVDKKSEDGWDKTLWWLDIIVDKMTEGWDWAVWWIGIPGIDIIVITVCDKYDFQAQIQTQIYSGQQILSNTNTNIFELTFIGKYKSNIFELTFFGKYKY